MPKTAFVASHVRLIVILVALLALTLTAMTVFTISPPPRTLSPAALNPNATLSEHCRVFVSMLAAARAKFC
jgi:hypothetical protein